MNRISCLSPNSLPIAIPEAIHFDNPTALLPLFDMSEVLDGIETRVSAPDKQILLSGRVGNTDFSLTIDLSGADGHTSAKQIITAARLFWYCYPQMYARFATENTPTDVILYIENYGYEIAEAWENKVHIHDRWLESCPIDFDCLTHEFAHTIQGDWQDEFMPVFDEDTYMVELFADYCRYLYCYQNGVYNDLGWELQTTESEDNYRDSVRFWVWLDYTYSTPEVDIIARMNSLIHERRFTSAEWEADGSAWQAVLNGTNAVGKDLHQLWELYAASEMANLPSCVEKSGEASPLLQAYPLRDAIRARYTEACEYLKVR